jgi:hypothetical protein
LWGWAKQKLPPGKLKNDLLFAKIHDKKSIWDIAAQKGDKEVLLKLYTWAQEELTPAEMNSRALFMEKRLKYT